MLATFVFSSQMATGRALGSLEQAFLAVAWLPKATVQAALAGLAYGYAAALASCRQALRPSGACVLGRRSRGC